MSAIAVEKVSKLWGDSKAVDGVSFEAPQGHFTVLLGPSGCGKSTTLRLIAGLESVTAGRILIGERDVTGLPPAQRDLSMVFQSYALFPHLSVAENILFGLKVRKVPRAERDERLRRTADLLGLSALLARRPSQLSGGQQQRVALGRAIIAEKPVCLMDEPLSNLDAKLRHEMRQEIRSLQQEARHLDGVRHPRSGRGHEHGGPGGAVTRGAGRADRASGGDLPKPGQHVSWRASSARPP